jgi:hypothetical protein
VDLLGLSRSDERQQVDIHRLAGARRYIFRKVYGLFSNSRFAPMGRKRVRDNALHVDGSVPASFTGSMADIAFINYR